MAAGRKRCPSQIVVIEMNISEPVAVDQIRLVSVHKASQSNNQLFITTETVGVKLAATHVCDAQLSEGRNTLLAGYFWGAHFRAVDSGVA